MNRILIVDDEENILKALRRELFEEDYEVEIASSAEEALGLLEKKPVQMVVSDIRMPSMDGLRFLEIVQLRWPYVNRAILSGFVDKSTALEALAKGIATAFIPKPWERVSLLQIIRKSLEIQQVLSNWKLLDAVTGIDKLPTLPRLYYELVQLLRKDAPVGDVAHLIEKDTGTTARILQVANSAFYGWRKITSVERAVSLIGTEGVRDIVLVSTLASQKKLGPGEDLLLDQILTQSQAVVRFMKDVHALHAKQPIPEALSCLGILQDVGKILMLQHLPSRIADVMGGGPPPAPWAGFFHRELAMGHEGCTHQEIGSYFLKWWNLPDGLVEAVLFHHAPEHASDECREIIETSGFVEDLVAWVWDNRRDPRADPSTLSRPWIPNRKLAKLATAIREHLLREEKSGDRT